MKKLFVLLCAALLVCATFPMAFADVDVETEVDKDWEADICIEANIEKAVYLGIKQLALIDSSAQADVTKNDANVGNVVVEIPQIKVIPGNDVLEEPDTVIVEPVLPLAILTDWAFNNASGVISVNSTSTPSMPSSARIACRASPEILSFSGQASVVSASVSCTWQSSTAISRTMPSSTMLRCSSGSITACSAFRISSTVVIFFPLAMHCRIGYAWTCPPC